MQNTRLSGKTALITAAGQGIGRAVAETFAAAGATVWASDVRPQALADLDGCKTMPLDVRDRDAIAAAIKQVGDLDVLVNCAGYVHSGSILDCDEEAWAFSMDLNVASMYRLSSAALPGMLARRRGSIINLSSVCGSIKGVPNRFVYGTTKAAIVGLTKSIAADFVTQGIRCNAICPGTVDTPSLQERLRASGDYEAARKAFTARQPMGRLGTAEEIASLALYLASDESAFVTGQCHVIDGGWAN
jgi:2-keto-3-deoxy-L-fuconate dehydrogenase